MKILKMLQYLMHQISMLLLRKFITIFTNDSSYKNFLQMAVTSSSQNWINAFENIWRWKYGSRFRKRFWRHIERRPIGRVLFLSGNDYLVWFGLQVSSHCIISLLIPFEEDVCTFFIFSYSFIDQQLLLKQICSNCLSFWDSLLTSTAGAAPLGWIGCAG